MAHETPIGRARGLGSAHHGTQHWLMQRFTAVGNVLAVGYLVISFMILPDFSYETVSGWLSSPLAGLALALLIITVFWHARLGLQVLIEDYVQGAGNRFAIFALLNILTFGGAGFGLFCIAKIAFAGAA